MGGVLVPFYKCGFSCVFFSIYDKVSEVSIVALLHNYSFFIITI